MPTELLIIWLLFIYGVITVAYELWLTFDPTATWSRSEQEFWQRIYLGLKALVWPALLVRFIYSRLLPGRVESDAH